MLNTSFLFASLLWSSVGLGYFIYGKKQQVFSAMGGGILMMAGGVFHQFRSGDVPGRFGDCGSGAFVDKARTLIFDLLECSQA